MTWIQFNYATFVQYYTEFSNSVKYPEQTLQLRWNQATTLINSNTATCGMTRQQRTEALNLMTAHLTELYKRAQTGQQAGLVQGATIDKVSVQLTPPPVPNQWQWWLNQTAYGSQLLALLQVLSVGGFFANGYPTVNTLRR